MTRSFSAEALLLLLVAFGWSIATTKLSAQISIGGQPYTFTHKVSDQVVPVAQMPALDMTSIQEEDERDESNGLPPRFGYPHEVNLNMDNSGQWETLPDGARLWRISIKAPGAKSINLLYDDFYLAPGTVLYIYGIDKKHVIGGFTAANNKDDRIFATGLLYSDQIVLEYYESKEAASQQPRSAISINYVVDGYRYIDFKPEDLEKAFGSSGSCNVNTICSQGDGWRDQIKSVALLLTSGFRFCTGYLVNNTAQDCRPLLLTANHCLGSLDAINNPSANTWTFMWRYESPNCSPSADGPTNMTTNGGTVLANPGSPGTVNASDFALLELAESPKTAGYDIYFSGFDATTTAPSAATCIHHPAGDVKKISMENDPLVGTSYGSSGGTPTHWRVIDYDSGTTEPGSSGSPIFSNSTKRAMGFLSGGGAACGNDLSDWFGQIGYSWNNNGASDSRRRLRDHLDPIGMGSNTFVDGNANPCTIVCDVMITGTTIVNETCPNANNGTITINATTTHGPLTYMISGPVNQSNGTGVFTGLPDGSYNFTVTDNGVANCMATGSGSVLAGVDNAPPMPVCRTTTVTLGGNGTYIFSASDVFNQGASMDNCGTVNYVSASPASVNCSHVNMTVPVTVTVNDGNGNSGTCTAQITVQQGTALPPGWTSGATGSATGSAIYKPCTEGGQFTVNSKGFDASLTGEATYEAYTSVCGNTTLTAHVSNLTGGGWAGISLRESLTAGSKMVALKTQLGNFVRREVRMTTNGLKSTQQFTTLPPADWLRIQRTGNIFSFYTSVDGVSWMLVGSATVSMSNCLLVGLYAESINVNTTTTATFDHVSVTGGMSPLLVTPNTNVEESMASVTGVTLYPNPSTGEVIVDLDGYVGRTVQLEVFNTLGQPVKSILLPQLESTQIKLDLSTYHEGIYLIRIQSEGIPVITRRLMLHTH